MNRDTKHLEKKKKLTSQLIGTCKFPGKMMINEKREYPQAKKASVLGPDRPDRTRDSDHDAIPSRRPKLRLPNREKRPLRDPLLLPARDAPLFVAEGPAVPVTFTKEP